jgi:hypothetical protein
MTQTETDCRIEIWHAIINHFQVTDANDRSDILVYLLWGKIYL